jgi:hypothetical protein
MRIIGSFGKKQNDFSAAAWTNSCQAEGAVQQHSNCRCHVREPSVAELRATPRARCCEREQRPLCTGWSEQKSIK